MLNFIKTKTNSKKIAYSILKVLSVLALTYFFYFLMYASLFNFDFDVTHKLVINKLPLTIASLSIMMTFYFGLWILLSNFIVSTVIYASFLSIIAVLNYYKVLILELPIFPSDVQMLKNAKELTGMVSSQYMLIIIAALLLVLVLIGVVVKIEIKKKKSKPLTRNTIVKIGIQSLCFFLILTSIPNIYNVKDHKKSFGRYVRTNGYATYAWNQLVHYQNNGPVLGYFSNFKGDIMTPPEGYSANKLREIETKYQSRADQINSEREHNSFDGFNVIYILSESLSNPNHIEGVTLSSNPLPYISSSEDKVANGIFISPAYGGSTANVEFEILTGMSTSLFEPSMRMPYQDFVSNYDHFDSIVQEFDHSESIHAYGSKFYKRESVFRSFGFTKQTYEATMNNKERLSDNAFISDASSYQELLDKMEENTDGSFYHLITMQNHGGYGDIYPEYNFEIEPHELLDPDTEATIRYYTEGISITDKATENFIEKVKNLDTKTIIFFYGDHAPGIYQSLKPINQDRSFFETDYFIYTNFEVERNDIPMISPLGVNTLMTDLLGIKVDAYGAMLYDMNSEFLSIRADQYILKDGESVQFEALTNDQKELISDYETMVYAKIKKK